MNTLRFDGFLLENFDEDAKQSNMEQNKGNLHNVALKAEPVINHTPFFFKPHMPTVEINTREYERIFPATPRKVLLDPRPLKVSLCNDDFCKKK